MDYTKNLDKEKNFSKEELEKEKEYLEELIVKSGMGV